MPVILLRDCSRIPCDIVEIDGQIPVSSEQILILHAVIPVDQVARRVVRDNCYRRIGVYQIDDGLCLYF